MENPLVFFREISISIFFHEKIKKQFQQTASIPSQIF